jgi:hypothetical protein
MPALVASALSTPRLAKSGLSKSRLPKSRIRAGLCALALAAAPAWANRDAASATPPQPAPAALPAAAAQAGTTLEDAVASVVVVALTEQFDGKPIAVNIDSYDVQVSGARERLVTGRGRVDVEGSVGSIAFSYRTLYDVLSSNAGYPAIAIQRVESGRTDAAAERAVPNDAVLIEELDRRVASALSGELGGRPVWLQLDSIESFETDQRYVRINASGIADFGLDGRTPTRVEALYDRTRQAWLRVNYELGVAPARGDLLSASGG